MCGKFGVGCKNFARVGSGFGKHRNILTCIGKTERKSATLPYHSALGGCQEVTGAALCQILFGNTVAVVGGAHNLKSVARGARNGSVASHYKNAMRFACTASDTSA